MLVHGTCVEVHGHGVLLRGPSGSGKSDLALRLIDGGARLVADDQVQLTIDGSFAHASAPPAISGRMEVRGIGILPVPSVDGAPVSLVVDLVAPENVPRLPEPNVCRLAGVDVACISLAPFEASAEAKVRLAVRAEARVCVNGRPELAMSMSSP